MKPLTILNIHPTDKQVDSIFNLRCQMEEKLSHLNEGLLSHEINLLREEPDTLLEAEVRQDAHALMALIQNALDML